MPTKKTTEEKEKKFDKIFNAYCLSRQERQEIKGFISQQIRKACQEERANFKKILEDFRIMPHHSFAARINQKIDQVIRLLER